MNVEAGSFSYCCVYIKARGKADETFALKEETLEKPAGDGRPGEPEVP